MVQCPFCHYNNEDGALFCEQCKSDLAGVAVSVESAAVAVEAFPMAAEVMPMEAMPVEAITDGGDANRSRTDGGDAGRSHAGRGDADGSDALGRGSRPDRASRAAPAGRRGAASSAPSAAPGPRGGGPSASGPACSCRAAPAPAAGAAGFVGKEPKLVVLRGNKRSAEYPIYEGQNFVGRADEKPVDIDLEDQEPPDRVWSSRQHACIFLENGELSIEDLNSSNGTFVNRARIYPGQKKNLSVGDVVQIGTVQLKVVV